MRAKDLMHSPVVTVRQDATVAELCDLMQQAHVNGVPVIDEDGDVVGVVTEEDVIYGTMGSEGPEGRMRGGAPSSSEGLFVRDIMTSPAVCAGEDADIVEICRLMWRMRIHRVPIVLEGKPVGIVSALDLVRAIAEGEIKP